MRSPREMRSVMVAVALRRAGFLVGADVDLTEGLELLRERYRARNPFEGIIVVGSLVFGERIPLNYLVYDVEQLVQVGGKTE